MRKLLLVVPLVAACSEGPTGPNVKVQVSPLELPGVGRVCYDLAVENGDTETVWSKGDPGLTSADGDDDTVCSDQYGNGAGGDVTYIGTCDASAPDHTVRLWVDTLESTGGAALTDWVDPCPDTGCALEVTCVENADTLVEFDITIMRRAQQGFFDVAVNFEDIFCSAKVDCTYDDAGEDPIELLFRDGERAQTAVIGFACSAGANESTHLLVSTPTVTCGSAGGTVASIVMNSWPNGDLLGYEVVSIDGSQQNVVLNPVLWSRTSDGWAAPSVLPIPGYNSAVPHSRVDDTRVIGEAFDTDGNGEFSSIVLWEWNGSEWQIAQTALSSATSGGLVKTWDPAFERVFLGPQDINNEGLINAYWDLSQSWVNEGPRSLPIDHDACDGRSGIGNIVAVSCSDAFGSQQAYGLDLDTNFLRELPQLLGDGSTQRQVENLTALSDGSIVGVLYAPEDNLRALHHWRRSEADWNGSLIGTTTIEELTVRWRDGDYFFVTRGGVPELHHIDGTRETWTEVTVDGQTPEGWTLQGAVELGGQVYVYGVASVPGGPAWVAGLLASGQPIALQALPSPIAPSDLPLYVIGQNSGKLWLSGWSFGEDERVVWQLDAGEPTLVADWRVVEPGLPIPTEVSFGAIEGPALTVSTFGGIDDNNHPFGFAPFASEAAAGSTVQGAALELLVGPGASSEATLDPTVDGNGWQVDEDPTDPVWQYAAYRGAEQLRCGAGSCNKLFWNFAIGFEQASSCTLHFAGTAMGSEFFAEGPTGEGLLRYPYVHVEVQLTDENGDMVCRRNPLDGDGSGVTSQYTAFDGNDPTPDLCFGYDGETTDSYCGF